MDSVLLLGIVLQTGIFGHVCEDGGTGPFPQRPLQEQNAGEARTPIGVGLVNTPGLGQAPECYAAMKKLGSLQTSRF